MIQSCSCFQLSFVPKSTAAASASSSSFLCQFARRTSSSLEFHDNNNNESPSLKEKNKTTKSNKPKAASQNYHWKSKKSTNYTFVTNSNNNSHRRKMITSNTSSPTNTMTNIIVEPTVDSVVPFSVMPPWMKNPKNATTDNFPSVNNNNNATMPINTYKEMNTVPDATTQNHQQVEVNAFMDAVFDGMTIKMDKNQDRKNRSPTIRNKSSNRKQQQNFIDEEKNEEYRININGIVESRLPIDSITENDVVFNRMIPTTELAPRDQLPSPDNDSMNATIALESYPQNVTSNISVSKIFDGMNSSMDIQQQEQSRDLTSGSNGKSNLSDAQVLSPQELLPTDENGNTYVPYPKSLSPSAILEFMECPQSFLFQYLLGLRQPTSLVLAKGSMCHHALQRVFDLEPSERSLPILQNLFRTAWQEHRLKDTYKNLFEKEEGVRDVDKERDWGREGLALLENYWKLEDASQVPRPNPLFREQWVLANLTVTPPILVRGIVDRLDMVQDTKHSVAMRLIDYKSGKAPDLKYSRAMNDKIVKDKFFQLLIYAWLLHTSGKTSQRLPLRYLRLLYLTSETGSAQAMDWDLGATMEERELILSDVGTQLENVWEQMKSLIDQQDLLAFPGCSRSFCWCHVCRERIVPGTVWTPPPPPSPSEDDKEPPPPPHDDACFSGSSNTALTG